MIIYKYGHYRNVTYFLARINGIKYRLCSALSELKYPLGALH